MLKTDTPRSTDISGECCAMLEELMLAQAQEMFYEMLSAKKAADGAGSAIKLATLAAVAWSVSELYEAAHEAYLKPQLVRHVQREWGESSKTKALLYKAEAHYMQARARMPIFAAFAALACGASCGAANVCSSGVPDASLSR